MKYELYTFNAVEPVVKINPRVNNFWQQTPILMKLVSVDRAFKELQNGTLFPASYLIQTPYLVKFTLHNLKVPAPVL